MGSVTTDLSWSRVFATIHSCSRRPWLVSEISTSIYDVSITLKSYTRSGEWFLKYIIIFKNDLQYLHLTCTSHVNHTSFNLNISWVLDDPFTNCRRKREFQMFLFQCSSEEAANCISFPASCSVQNYWRANWLWTLLLIGLSGQLYQPHTNRHNNHDLRYPYFVL